MGFLPLLLNFHLYICETCILWNSCCYCQQNIFGDVDKLLLYDVLDNDKLRRFNNWSVSYNDMQ